MTDPAWVDTDRGLSDVLAEISGESHFALDTEFHGERTYFPKLALVQIAWRGGIALVDPLAVDIAPLREALDGPATLVAHAGDQDLAILEQACGCGPRNYFDTQIAAGFVGLGTPALARLCEQLLDVHLTKGDRLTDWTQRPLRDGQRRYAAADVEYLLPLYAELRERLVKLNRLEWAEDEFLDRLRRDRSPQDPNTAWWKIKGARSLRGKHRKVAQTVGAWRERSAVAKDLPPRFVLSDLALSGVVHRVPTTISALRSIRGLESGFRDQEAEALLAAVREGMDLDDATVINPPPATKSDRRYQSAVALLGAWIGAQASDLALEPSLLGTRADITELVARGTGRLSTGWRAEIAGEPIRRLLAGELCVVLDSNGTKLVLEPRAGAGNERMEQR